MPTLKIAESLIRQNASNKSFERGRDYARSRAVSDLVWRGQILRSSVVGNEYYSVSIRFSGQSKQIVQDATCSCPYDYGDWCKHIVATLLVANDQGNIEERPSLAQLLERLDLEQTRKLLDNLVVENPDLIDQVDLQVELLTAVKPTNSKSTKSKAAKSSQNQRPEIDRSPFRRNVRYEIREALRSIEEDYIEEDPFIDVIDEEIKKATGFLDAGDSFRAFVMLYATAEELAVHKDDIDDYSGDSDDLIDPLDRSIAEAILWTDFSVEEREKWASEIEGIQDSLGVELEQSLTALSQGWDDPQLLAILAGEFDTREIEQLKPAFCELGYTRLNVLESQERFEEYLRFAKTLGFLVPYVTMLIQLGRFEQAIASAEKIENHEQAFAIAQKLLEHGSEQEALRIAHKGLQFLEEGSSSHYASELAVWTSALAEQLGETKILLNAKVIAFKLKPSLADYHEIRDLTGDKWNSTKEILLKYLSRLNSYGISDAKVDIFLEEGLIDQAIAVVDSDYCSRQLRLRVMQVAAGFDPQWVITKGKALAEDIINRGKSEHYDDAVSWLEQVKRAYLASNQQEEWRSYRQQLVEVNSKKRKLMEIVKRKGL